MTRSLIAALCLAAACLSAHGQGLRDPGWLASLESSGTNTASFPYWTDPYAAVRVLRLDFDSTNAIGNFIDTSGRNHGVTNYPTVATGPNLISGAFTNAAGDLNGVISEDAVNDSVNVTPTADLSFVSGTNDIPFTIAFWANRQAATQYRVVLSKWQSAASCEWLMYYEDAIGKVHLEIDSLGSGAGQLGGFSYGPLLSNTWCCMIWTYDGSGSIDGVNTWTGTNGGTLAKYNIAGSANYAHMSATTNYVCIGNYAYGNGSQPYLYSGQFDLVYLYTQAFTAAAATNFFANTSPTNQVIQK